MNGVDGFDKGSFTLQTYEPGALKAFEGSSAFERGHQQSLSRGGFRPIESVCSRIRCPVVDLGRIVGC